MDKSEYDFSFKVSQKNLENDPKRKEVLHQVQLVLAKEKNPKRKIVIFTEYADTVTHLKEYFNKHLIGRVLFSDGNVTKKFAQELNANFNAKYEPQRDDYDILITSDKLSEGVNLNRAGLIINYDIPWNPTRVIQRVGRINRIGTKVFDELYIYNFFPTEQGASQVKIREIAEQKMFLIHTALGEDSKIFNPDEVPSPSGLFKKINSIPEEDDELNIVTIVRNKLNKIRKEHPEILEKRAANSLKSLLKVKREELNQKIISFMDTLLKDIKRYKTLPKNTLRKLVLPEKTSVDAYKELIENIETLRRKMGDGYLDIMLKHTDKIDDDIIIAVENSSRTNKK